MVQYSNNFRRQQLERRFVRGVRDLKKKTSRQFLEKEYVHNLITKHLP